MPNPPRNLPHLFLNGGGESEPYTAHPAGGGRKRLPDRDRQAHGAKLALELATAVGIGRAAVLDRPPEFAAAAGERSAEKGFYLEFSMETTNATGDALASLEDIRKGIELVAVRPSSDVTAGATIATVFVPDRSADHFAKRVDEFREKETRSGKPKNQNLIASISAVRVATPQSVFTDLLSSFPDDPERELWWEVWIRRGFDAQLETACQRTGIVVKAHTIRFPERSVRIVRATARKLERLMRLTAAIAELRLAKDSPAFFMRESGVEQAQWVDDLLARLGDDPTGTPEIVICLLDGGVTREHPLLVVRVRPADLLTVEQAWGTADNAPFANGGGHGTGMAGLALYGDLADVFITQDGIDVPYWLESVKILPPAGANEPELYGAIVTEAIGRAEAAEPHRFRIVCCAITSANSGESGRPSSWSAAMDSAAFGAFDIERLIVLAAGNIREHEVSWVADYLERNDTAEVESPAQAWNALTVGAYTEKLNISDPQLAGWNAVAPAGDLCPASRTGLTFASQWPVKPDVVFEGGNYANDGGPTIDAADDLQLLTTHRNLQHRLLTTFGDTSAATALAANFAARVAAARPLMRPETVRALIVHSAEWTSAMLARSEAETGAARKRVLLRRYGYGVPNLERALRSATNDLTLIVEDAIQPFKLEGSSIKTREMHVHRLPWPVDVLESLGETDVQLRVTLSYFVEPNPGERGWTRRHRYASHGLRFEVKHQLESDDAFRRRLNRATENDDEDVAAGVSNTEGWQLGSRARSTGSIHSDTWKGTAVELAQRGAIGIFPIGGWWREAKGLNRFNNAARYSLVATIRVPDREVDIYTPVRIALGIGIATAIEIET